MEEIILQICDSIGPKWPQLYSRLGLDYRGRYQITAANAGMAPERVKHRQCAWETLSKWQKETPSLKDMTEKQQIGELLTCLHKIKDMDGLAIELALKYSKHIMA
jgi:hypothetical protein